MFQKKTTALNDQEKKKIDYLIAFQNCENKAKA